MDPAKIALFDMDGTLVDFNGAMERDMRSLQHPDEEPFVRKPGDDDVPYLDARMQMIRRQPGWWLNLPKYEPGWEILRIAEACGFDITILTKGPYRTTNAWTEKVEWVRRELPNAKVTITEDKSMAYGRVLVDDWPKYVLPWLKHRPRGLAILPAHPWNEGFDHPRAIRYDGKAGRVIRALMAAYDRDNTAPFVVPE